MLSALMMEIIRSRFFLKISGSIPLNPSLAPVSRMIISGFNTEMTHRMRDNVPLLVSPLTPALTTLT